MFSLNSDSLVPVITAQLGKPVTFTCVIPDGELGSKQLFWYKQSVGDTLKLIAGLKKFSKPDYKPEFNNSRLEIKLSEDLSSLTIQRTIHEDEGMYHCGVVDYSNYWSGIYLSVKGI